VVTDELGLEFGDAAVDRAGLGDVADVEPMRESTNSRRPVDRSSNTATVSPRARKPSATCDR
jgi:hypothetical protein